MLRHFFMPSVTEHYSQNLHLDTLVSTLHSLFPDGVSEFHIAPLDQLHIGGIKASAKLAARLAEYQPQCVLDIGSGLGGLLRLCANTHSACYIGLDLTHDLNRLHQSLNRLHQHQPVTTCITADGQQIPLDNGCIDLIFMQHSLLNMPNPLQCLKECQRILHPAGKLIMHEVIKGPSPQAMQYPVPWAGEAELSHLQSEVQLLNSLQQAGFTQVHIEDWTREALDWRQRQSAKTSATTTGTKLNPAWVFGDSFSQMGQNVQHNLEQGAIRILEIVLSPRSLS